ncbi:uncharacterized protein LOC135485354 isoform X2 [Lineus longissimus]|uniref:uncharacterized protein LOC135485354 isoform X2 n=1 Tax=Lineus longissimus TaxID=88925 RepID=UPI00315D6FBD
MNCLVEYRSSDSESDIDDGEKSTTLVKKYFDSEFGGKLGPNMPSSSPNKVDSLKCSEDICHNSENRMSSPVCHEEAAGVSTTVNRNLNSENCGKPENVASGEPVEVVQLPSSKPHSDITAEPKNDFFNLSSDSDDLDSGQETTETFAEEILEAATKKIDTQFGSVGIPGGKYWNDFTPTEIKTRGRRNPEIHSKRMRDNMRHKEEGHGPHLKYRKPDNLAKQTTPKLTADKYVSKKIFYVHHKIGPHLVNSSPPSRPPKKEVIKVNAHGSGINRLRWCSRKEYSHLIVSASMDTTVKIWNLFSSERPEEELQTLKHHTKGVRDIVWSHSAKEILSCGYDRKVFFSDVEKGISIRCYDHDDFVTCLAVHPVEPHIFVSGTRNAILCWDMRTNVQQPVKEFRYKDDIGQVQDVLFINNGAELISTGDIVTRDSADRNIMAWDFRTTVVLSNQVYQERYTCIRLLYHPEDRSFLVQTNGAWL